MHYVGLLIVEAAIYMQQGIIFFSYLRPFHRVIKSGKMRWDGHVARMGGGERRNTILVMGKLEGNGLVGKTRLRWAENNKMYLQEMGWGRGLDWSGSG
jgi:hypothetical protein